MYQLYIDGQPIRIYADHYQISLSITNTFDNSWNKPLFVVDSISNMYHPLNINLPRFATRDYNLTIPYDRVTTVPLCNIQLLTMDDNSYSKVSNTISLKATQYRNYSYENIGNNLQYPVTVSLNVSDNDLLFEFRSRNSNIKINDFIIYRADGKPLSYSSSKVFECKLYRREYDIYGVAGKVLRYDFQPEPKTFIPESRITIDGQNLFGTEINFTLGLLNNGNLVIVNSSGQSPISCTL